MVALVVSVPFYPFFLRSMEAAAERKRALGAGHPADPIPPAAGESHP